MHTLTFKMNSCNLSIHSIPVGLLSCQKQFFSHAHILSFRCISHCLWHLLSLSPWRSVPFNRPMNHLSSSFVAIRWHSYLFYGFLLAFSYSVCVCACVVRTLDGGWIRTSTIYWQSYPFQKVIYFCNEKLLLIRKASTGASMLVAS